MPRTPKKRVFLPRHFAHKARAVLTLRNQEVADLAREMKVAVGTLQHWIAGRTSMEPERYEQIRDFLGADSFDRCLSEPSTVRNGL